MKAVLTVLACVLAAIVVLVVVRGQITTGSGSGSLGLGGGTGGSVTSGRPDVTTSATADSTGTPNVTQRGTNSTNHVDCASIDSKLKISANAGAIRWKATSASGVSVTPSSGFLDKGESEVVRIGGSYSGGGGFTVVVSVPNRVGAGSVNWPFTCV
ncbi:hypothetical protein [Frankia sp. Cppng1_Ct_nod]|uniref:hypothetical protein n=1 Tax=Frankia sp. Cppng1_Ct_nod TaxID=2897162 RepID=UPI001F5EA789|nr:hypothetical protein [Frankia sp. Cppng1_Ct_nod]